MASVTPKSTLTLDLPPCCVEFSPLHPTLAFIGTYHLNQQNPDSQASEDDLQTSFGQQRSGSVVVLNVSSTLSVVYTHTTDYGILDLHFSPYFPDIFATANSTSSIALFSTPKRILESETELTPRAFFSPFPHGVLALALQWHPNHSQVLGISLSNGQVVLINLSSLGSDASQDILFDSLRTISSHTLEAWTLSIFTIDPTEQTFLYSGGDDMTLMCTKHDGTWNPAWKDGRIHSAGVTAILPLSSDLILTGSYDDKLRLLQIGPSRRHILAEKDLGGGVWRIKVLHEWSTTRDFVLLVSCMYAGARLIRLAQSATNSWDISVLARIEEHKSMNYASDYLFPAGSGNIRKVSILSTSFYDKLVCLSVVNQPK